MKAAFFRMMSKHYSKDDRFFGFVEKISNGIVDAVRRSIVLEKIRRENQPNEKKSIFHDAKNLLEKWKNEFRNFRSRIEKEKRSFAIWKFDEKILFEKNDLIAKILDDFIELWKILEKENSIGEIFASLQFDPFEPKNEENWRRFFETFRNQTKSIEKQRKDFRQKPNFFLESKENFLHAEQIDSAFLHLHEQLDKVERIFHENKEKPPICKVFSCFS